MERSQVKYRRIIHRPSGRVRAIVASRLNFTEQTFEYGIAYVHPDDVYDRDLGKKLALERLEQAAFDSGTFKAGSITAKRLIDVELQDAQTSGHGLKQRDNLTLRDLNHFAFERFIGYVLNEYYKDRK